MTKIKQTKRAGYKEACELLRRAYKYRRYNTAKMLNDNEAMYYICEGLFKGCALEGVFVSPDTATDSHEFAIRETLRNAFLYFQVARSILPSQTSTSCRRCISKTRQ